MQFETAIKQFWSYWSPDLKGTPHSQTVIIYKDQWADWTSWKWFSIIIVYFLRQPEVWTGFLRQNVSTIVSGIMKWYHLDVSAVSNSPCFCEICVFFEMYILNKRIFPIFALSPMYGLAKGSLKIHQLNSC